MSEGGIEAPGSLAERLGGLSGFEPTAAADAVVAALFDAHADEWHTAFSEALVLSPSWGNDIDVQPMAAAGPRFTRKALDLLRIEKFKMDIKGALTEALTHHFEASAGTHDEAVTRQVAAPYGALGATSSRHSRSCERSVLD